MKRYIKDNPSVGISFGITGGTGAVGTQLLRYLLKRPDAKAIYILTRSTDEKAQHKLATKYDKIHLVQGDLLNVEALRELVKQSGIVFHLGGWSGLNKISQEQALSVNCLSTALLCKLARQKNTRLVFTSTVGVYQLSTARKGIISEKDLHLPLDVMEELDTYHSIIQDVAESLLSGKIYYKELLRRPLSEKLAKSLYFFTKLLAERFVTEYEHGTVLRLGNVYGAGDETERAIPKFIKEMVWANENECKTFIPGRQNSLIYIKDLLKALYAAATITIRNDNKIIIVADSKSVTQEDLFLSIKKLTNSAARIAPMDKEKMTQLGITVPPKIAFNTTLMANELGLSHEQLTDIEEGLNTTKEWLIEKTYSEKWAAIQDGGYTNKINIRSDKKISGKVKDVIKTEAYKLISKKPYWPKVIHNPHIWMVTAETRTFMKTGGLADVAVDLAEAFNKRYNKGVGSPKMTIIQPLYESGELVILRRLKSAAAKYEYTSIPLGNSIELVDAWKEIEVAISNNKTTTISVLKGTFKGIEYIFLRNKRFFGNLSNDGKVVKPFAKNDYSILESENFAFFSKAVSNYIKDLKENDSKYAPDIIVANDWHAAPISAQLRYLMQAKADNGAISKSLAQKLKDIYFIYIIHNLGYQGWGSDDNTSQILNLLYEGYANSIFKSAYVPDMQDTSRSIIIRDTYNAAIHGLSLADIVVAVSPNYAKEIASHKFYGYDFVDLLRKRQTHGNLIGILNGIGQEDIAPDGRLTIEVNGKFSSYGFGNAIIWYNKNSPKKHFISAKAENKRKFINFIRENTLQSVLNVETTDGNNFSNIDLAKIDETPLLTVVTRLEEQKGIEIMAAGIRYAVTRYVPPGKEKPVVVILGTGSEANVLNQLKDKFPEVSERVLFFNTFSNTLKHIIQIAGDMFLMPSKFEPCGLGQLESMAKGNVPVANATGGLADTIKDGHTGYLSEYNPDDLIGSEENYRKALTKALNTFYNKRTEFDDIAYKALQEDFSWENSGSLEKYFKLFQTGNIDGRSEQMQRRTLSELLLHKPQVLCTC